MRERVVDALASEGYLMDQEAEDYILAQSDPLQFAHRALSSMQERPLIITMRDLRKTCLVPSEKVATLQEVPRRRNVKVEARGHGDIVITKDITNASDCDASVAGFANYFMDRFETLRGLLQKRRDLVGASTIDRVLDANRLMVDREVKLIGMVNDVKEFRSGDRLVELEDETGKVAVMIPKDHRLANESILYDEVLGIIGKPTARDKKIVANAIIRPDVPHGSQMERRDLSSVIGFMSDVHVGSNTFLKRPWEDMIEWVRTEGPEIGLQYLVVPGDCVDGIGIYPNQEEELDIEDIFEQYRVLAELLKDVPDHIQVIVQPGNHDAVRPAEPQPAFSGDIGKLFDSSTILIGNPAYFEVEGRTILSYHGKSFDDLMASVKGLSYSNPIQAMKEMLKRRHLVPIYGGRTPIAPERKDFLVIDKVPDIFVTGHVHGAGLDHYNGVRLINASTWQSQTPFQKMHNFNPEPAKLILVHLGNGSTHMEDFNS